MLHTKLFYCMFTICFIALRISRGYGVRNVKNTLKQHKNIVAALQI